MNERHPNEKPLSTFYTRDSEGDRAFEEGVQFGMKSERERIERGTIGPRRRSEFIEEVYSEEETTEEEWHTVARLDIPVTTAILVFVMLAALFFAAGLLLAR